jgi:microcystin degradation protein MlrC
MRALPAATMHLRLAANMTAEQMPTKAETTINHLAKTRNPTETQICTSVRAAVGERAFYLRG